MSETKVLYMLRGLDDLEAQDMGPYWGPPGLDLVDLANQFRQERYAEAQTAHEDYCWLHGSEFGDWLVARNFVTEAVFETLAFSLTGGDSPAYVPEHWPECPHCLEGRGADTRRNTRTDLNRIEVARVCTACAHEWDVHDEQYLSTSPMLEDDGRHVPSGCVPYSLSMTMRLPFDQVSALCRQHGWTESEGMHVHHAITAAARLGYTLHARHVEAKISLRRLIDRLPRVGRFIVGTEDHWLAIVDGKNLDQSSTHGRKVATGCWEVLPT